MRDDDFERSQRQNAEERRAFIRRWAEYVRTHDDEEWSRQQNKRGDTDPVAFIEARDRCRTDDDE
jgi:hypothetical protein